MPGHMKQTNATVPSWNLGDAYQGVVKRPILNRRYIHPEGSSSSPVVALMCSGGGLSVGPVDLSFPAMVVGYQRW